MRDDESSTSAPLDNGREHLTRLIDALSELEIERIERWGRRLAGLLGSGHRLLVAGNGGSAAEAQHLTAELVGRFERERRPMSALALHSDTSTLTATSNDYGYDEVFARQVRAHGRPGDVLLTLSTSGRSRNVRNATAAARDAGLITWALTGPGPNPLAALSDEAITVPAVAVATVQECHLVAIHLLCRSVDAALDAELPVRIPRSRQRLVVVGDALLDRDRTGSVNRLSPEAPVPVVGDVAVTSRPGGAALAAALAARNGSQVTLITAIAPDSDGDELRTLLAAAGVEVIDLGLAGSTPVKTRIRAAGRTMLMLDEAPAPAERIGDLPDSVRDVLNSAAGVLVSDYGRGLAELPELRTMLADLVSTTPVVWDPHPRGPAPVPGVCVATPSSREAAHFAPADGQGLTADIASARALLGRWSATRVAVTRGRLGAVLVQDPHTAPLVVNAPAAAESDSCGAGDQFAVATAALLAGGMLPSEAVAEAVMIASAYVADGGPATALSGSRPVSPRGDGTEPVALAQRVRATGGTVVATGGCFDLLHTGHIRMLDEARRLGDCLIVCLNSDDSVARLKGPARPIVAAADRATMLLALRSVDAVLVFDEDTPEQALCHLRPDVFVKGGDYSMVEIPESAVMRSWGGQVIVVPYLAGRSTTSLIRDAVQETR